MSEKKDFFNKNFRLIVFAAVIVMILYFIISDVGAFGNVLLVLLGFGSVIMIHEFGHFIVAKLSDIKVEAFSIFMPPTLIGHGQRRAALDQMECRSRAGSRSPQRDSSCRSNRFDAADWSRVSLYSC